MKSEENRKGKIIGILAPIVLVAMLLGLWELLVYAYHVPPTLLSPPSAVFACIVNSFSELWPHIKVTLSTILLGFLLGAPFGMLFAAIVTNFKLVNDAINPFLILLVVTPLMTLMPLLCVWMGFDQNVRIVGTMIQCFPIVSMMESTGLNNVPTMRVELMQSMKASRLQRFFRVALPSALPDVFTGLRLATIFATTGCIAIEYISSNSGLGNRIQFYTVYYKMDHAFACIFIVAFIGAMLYILMLGLEKLIVKWKI